VNEDEMGMACSNIGGRRRNAHMILVGKQEGRIPLGRPRHRWMDLRKIGWNGMDWIDLLRIGTSEGLL
jgi:hypothetical protein